MRVPKDVMDNYLGYPSNQCLIELLDYWLRHHPGQLTWKEVAQALREIKLHQLAEKAIQISTTGKLADSRYNVTSMPHWLRAGMARPHD